MVLDTWHMALTRAAALCSKSEHCASEIEKKAVGWGLSPEESDRLVAELRREGFIDDARFVHAFVHDKYEYQHWGKSKIRYGLLQKRLPASLVDAALEEVIGEEEYLETLVELLRAKMRGMSQPLAMNDRARLYRFAAQRGYDAGVIGRALRLLNAQVDNEME